MKWIVVQACRLGLFTLLLATLAGCDRVGDIASGVGSETKALADKISGGSSSKPDDDVAEQQTNNQSASGVIGGSVSGSTEEDSEDDDPDPGSEPEADPEPEVVERRSSQFDLVFEMSYQSCSSCGIWFDSAELVIVHSEGKLTARQSGSLLIKEAPYHQGRFKADISAISLSAEIESATLHMLLNAHEGISNDDYTSSIAVYGYIDGNQRYVREITAAEDIKGRGYSKANPNVPIDFTDYARSL